MQTRDEGDVAKKGRLAEWRCGWSRWREHHASARTRLLHFLCEKGSVPDQALVVPDQEDDSVFSFGRAVPQEIVVKLSLHLLRVSSVPDPGRGSQRRSP